MAISAVLPELPEWPFELPGVLHKVWQTSEGHRVTAAFWQTADAESACAQVIRIEHAPQTPMPKPTNVRFRDTNGNFEQTIPLGAILLGFEIRSYPGMVVDLVGQHNH